jgi:hypothetical protein
VARYYFHVFNDEITLDEEGYEFPDLDGARAFAVKNARSLVCESVQKGHLNLDHRIEIADEAGARKMTVTFREAFTIQG